MAGRTNKDWSPCARPQNHKEPKVEVEQAHHTAGCAVFLCLCVVTEIYFIYLRGPRTAANLSATGCTRHMGHGTWRGPTHRSQSLGHWGCTRHMEHGEGEIGSEWGPHAPQPVSRPRGGLHRVCDILRPLMPASDHFSQIFSTPTAVLSYRKAVRFPHCLEIPPYMQRRREAAAGEHCYISSGRPSQVIRN